MANWIIDAGHGGTDPGFVANGVKEKDWTLEAALYIQKRLKDLGISAAVTRTKDVTLSENERVNKVKQYKYCISCHFNAGGGNGLETIHSIYADGKFEHRLVEIAKNEGFPLRPRPVYTRTYPGNPKQDYYYMHRRTGACRTTIVEFDFLDGPNINKLKDKKYRERLYECVVHAICNQEGKPYKDPNEEKPAAPAKPKGKVVYKVQIGAFADKKNALELAEKAKKAGFSVYISEEKS